MSALKEASFEPVLHLYLQYYHFFHERNPNSAMTRVYKHSVAFMKKDDRCTRDLWDSLTIPGAEIQMELTLLSQPGPKGELQELLDDMTLLGESNQELLQCLMLALERKDRSVEVPSLDQLHVLTAAIIRTICNVNTLEELSERYNKNDMLIQKLLKYANKSLAEIKRAKQRLAGLQ